MMRAGFLGFLLLLAGCSQEHPVSVEFRAEAGGAPIGCGGAVALTDLRFYVYDVALIGRGGETIPLRMDEAAPWQNGRVALLDLEDGKGTCHTGSFETRTVVAGRARADEYRGITFTLGVPFDLNHANPVEALSPLDQTVMHWHWQAGYKFMRAGIVEGDRQTWVHVGSTGCKGRIGAVEECAKPNRFTVTLRDFDPSMEVVVLDVADLFKNARGENEKSCMAEPENPTCDAIFTNLATGAVFSHAAR